MQLEPGSNHVVEFKNGTRLTLYFNKEADKLMIIPQRYDCQLIQVKGYNFDYTHRGKLVLESLYEQQQSG